MRKLLNVLLCIAVLVPLAGCGDGESSDPTKPDSSGPTNKYAYGTWLTKAVSGNGDSFDLVFRTDMTYQGTAARRSTPTIYGTYSINADGSAHGDFKSYSGGRVGYVDMHFVDAAATILFFRFTETNAFNNPNAVNGVIAEDFQGPNTDPPPSGGGGGGNPPPTTSGDEIPFAQITWYGTQSPAGWPAVGKLDTLTVDPTTKWGTTPAPTICWSWKVPAWPAVSKGVIGSQWVIAKIGGQWVATPWEYVTAAPSMCRQTEAGNPAKGGHPGDPPFIQGQAGPITSWIPKKGEEVGFMNSTIARGPAPPSPHERTYIKKILWP